MASEILTTAANAVLQAVVDAFAAEGVALPERQFISDGDVAIDDCEQLAIQIASVYVGSAAEASETPLKRSSPFDRFCDVVVWLTRCVPVIDDQGNPPDAAEITASSEIVLRDGWVLFEGLLKAYQSGALQDACLGMSVGRMEGIGPEGGFGGWRLPLRFQV